MIVSHKWKYFGKDSSMSSSGFPVVLQCQNWKRLEASEHEGKVLSSVQRKWKLAWRSLARPQVKITYGFSEDDTEQMRIWRSMPEDSPCRYLEPLFLWIQELSGLTVFFFFEMRDIEVHCAWIFFSVQYENWLVVVGAGCHKVSQEFHVIARIICPSSILFTWLAVTYSDSRSVWIVSCLQEKHHLQQILIGISQCFWYVC